MATHTHAHTGLPCNVPDASPDCSEPGAVTSCNHGTGLLGPVWICVHEVPAPPGGTTVTPPPKPTPVTPGAGPGPVVPPPPPPKIQHDCETFDEGVEKGFVFANAIDAKVGIAIRDARRAATKRAEDAAAAASKNHVCKGLCEKFDNVSVDLWNPSINKIGTGANATFSVTVVATWYLDILCVIVPKTGKGGGGSKKKSGKRKTPGGKRKSATSKSPAKKRRLG